jgi:hypothetical protein
MLAKMKILYWAVRFLILTEWRHLFVLYGNFLVSLHFRFTPYNSTENSLNEIILQQLQIRITKNEQYTYKLWTKLYMIAVGKLNAVDYVSEIRNRGTK